MAQVFAEQANLGEVVNDEERDLVENDTVDYIGRRANKKTTGGWLTGPRIFGAELCERMSAFGISFNLVTYLVLNLHQSKPYAANMVTNFLGTCYITCLIGGFVADTWLGRHLTIIVFGAIQFSGLVLITLFASLPAFWQPPCAPPNVQCTPVHGIDLATLYIALYLIALGTGGIKSCVSGFGADQFDYNDPLEKKYMTLFFNWFFFFISGGGLFAVTVLVYAQDKIGRGWGYGITSSCMLFAVVAFASGRKAYRYSLPKGSPFSGVVRVIVAAFKKRKLKLPSNPAAMLHETGEENTLFEKIAHTDQFLFLSKAAIVPDVDYYYPGESPHISTFPGDVAERKIEQEKDENGRGAVRMVTVTQVEEVKILIRLLPILFTTFFFWTVHAQMITFTLEQAVIMDRKLSKHFEIPSASVAVFLQLSIMIVIVLYDRLFVQLIGHYTGRLQGITTLQRIGVGLVLSVLTMVAAALVENKRRGVSNRLGPHAQISVFWLLPQYVLVGTGEVFTYVGQLEFFYRESPSSMRSMGTAFCLCTLSIGYYSSSFLVDTVDRFSKTSGGVGWLANDLNSGHLDRFYCLLAVCSTLNFFVYLVAAKWYKYRPKPGNDGNDSLHLDQCMNDDQIFAGHVAITHNRCDKLDL